MSLWEFPVYLLTKIPHVQVYLKERHTHGAEWVWERAGAFFFDNEGVDDPGSPLPDFAMGWNCNCTLKEIKKTSLRQTTEEAKHLCCCNFSVFTLVSSQSNIIWYNNKCMRDDENVKEIGYNGTKSK